MAMRTRMRGHGRSSCNVIESSYPSGVRNGSSYLNKLGVGAISAGISSQARQNLT